MYSAVDRRTISTFSCDIAYSRRAARDRYFFTWKTSGPKENGTASVTPRDAVTVPLERRLAELPLPGYERADDQVDGPREPRDWLMPSGCGGCSHRMPSLAAFLVTVPRHKTPAGVGGDLDPEREQVGGFGVASVTKTKST